MLSRLLILLFCKNKCLIRKLFSMPARETKLFWFSQTIYRLGKCSKFVSIVAARSPRCTYVVFFAYFEFFIGIASHGFASISCFIGLVFVSKNYIVWSILPSVYLSGQCFIYNLFLFFWLLHFIRISIIYSYQNIIEAPYYSYLSYSKKEYLKSAKYVDSSSNKIYLQLLLFTKFIFMTNKNISTESTFIYHGDTSLASLGISRI
jgi:hypothetical protein